MNNGSTPDPLDEVRAILREIAAAQRESDRRHDDWKEQFDQRLNRLTERHEALAQTVELSHRDWEAVRQQMNDKFSQTLEFINQLAHVAESHERRLDDLESGQR